MESTYAESAPVEPAYAEAGYAYPAVPDPANVPLADTHGDDRAYAADSGSLEAGLAIPEYVRRRPDNASLLDRLTRRGLRSQEDEVASDMSLAEHFAEHLADDRFALDRFEADDFADDEPNSDPVGLRGLRWIRRNVSSLRVTVSLQRGTPPTPPKTRKPPSHT